MEMDWGVWLAMCIFAWGAAFLVWGGILRPQKNRQRLHHVRIKSAHGVITKLVLNDQQYEQFSAWLNGPDGVYEISDERARVVLERRYVAAVEVRVR